MCNYNFKFKFGTKNFQTNIKADNDAEANIRFKDFITNNVVIISKEKEAEECKNYESLQEVLKKFDKAIRLFSEVLNGVRHGKA